MQSAQRNPIMITFAVEDQALKKNENKPDSEINPFAMLQNRDSSNINDKYPQPAIEKKEKIVSCIFKTRDDVRQDTLSLQVIKIFKEIFIKYDMDLYVYPYSTISNRTGALDEDLGGIIECIPDCASRDQLGKAFDSDLYKYFIDKFGQE